MSTLPFQHLLVLEPLGLLYGSSGRMLSPEALTGRASEHFPPDSPTLAGLIGSQLKRGANPTNQASPIRELFTAGPFCFDTVADDLWLPAPFTLLQHQEREDREPFLHRLHWHPSGEAGGSGSWRTVNGAPMPRKTRTGGWIALRQWPLLRDPSDSAALEGGLRLHRDPWQAVPHLHPRLCDAERVSAGDDALFLEYGIALKPGFRLAYLSSQSLPDGRYRFGGEGHLVELRCLAIPKELQDLLLEPLDGAFALITPGLWGGPRLSRRDPLDSHHRPAIQPWHRHGVPPAILTERPRPWRHQLGSADPRRPRRLSRGRWALPAGTCYRVANGLPPWVAWPETWFPKEGFSFKQLGTALALPLHVPSSSCTPANMA